MKILRVISSVDPANGGPINGLMNTTEFLQKLGHEVEVLCLDDPDSKWVKQFPYRLHAKGGLSSFRYNCNLSAWLQTNLSSFDRWDTVA